eukprot:TRINITY_DN829_c0_g1_i1.p1 TRINITY_DN829_c0_g1~~TRINITY_DN829_c0_g1_i1.p1  ORF type:complete len:498 (-),score=140.83 TRINITY_DN829_c0_g1_i1:37-1530(-)
MQTRRFDLKNASQKRPNTAIGGPRPTSGGTRHPLTVRSPLPLAATAATGHRRHPSSGGGTSSNLSMGSLLGSISSVHHRRTSSRDMLSASSPLQTQQRRSSMPSAFGSPGSLASFSSSSSSALMSMRNHRQSLMTSPSASIASPSSSIFGSSTSSSLMSMRGHRRTPSKSSSISASSNALLSMSVSSSVSSIRSSSKSKKPVSPAVDSWMPDDHSLFPSSSSLSTTGTPSVMADSVFSLSTSSTPSSSSSSSSSSSLASFKSVSSSSLLSVSSKPALFSSDSFLFESSSGSLGSSLTRPASADKTKKKTLSRTLEKVLLKPGSLADVALASQPLPFMKQAFEMALRGRKALVSFVEQDEILKKLETHTLEELTESMKNALLTINYIPPVLIKCLWRFVLVVNDLIKGDRLRHLQIAESGYAILLSACNPKKHRYEFAALTNSREMVQADLAEVVAMKTLNDVNVDVELPVFDPPFPKTVEKSWDFFNIRSLSLASPS